MPATLRGLDLAATGRQLGSIDLTVADGRHGYGVVPIPVAVLSGEPGPTALLVAGTHGDEYEGQVLLHRLVRDTDPSRVTGRLIVVPALNLPAVRAGSRISPLDGQNLNRVYPGKQSGGPTEQLAHVIVDQLLPNCDYVLDLHSGGTLTRYLPSSFVYDGPDAAQWARKKRAAEVLGLTWSMRVPSRFEPGSLSTACDDAGICMISAELFGGASVTPSVVAHAQAGLQRLLAHWGVVPRLEDLPVAEATRWINLDSRSAVPAPARGLFDPVCELGQQVAAGELLGRVHPIEELDAPAIDVFADRDGVIAVVRLAPVVELGDTLCSVAGHDAAVSAQTGP